MGWIKNFILYNRPRSIQYVLGTNSNMNNISHNRCQTFYVYGKMVHDVLEAILEGIKLKNDTWME